MDVSFLQVRFNTILQKLVQVFEAAAVMREKRRRCNGVRGEYSVESRRQCLLFVSGSARFVWSQTVSCPLVGQSSSTDGTGSNDARTACALSVLLEASKASLDSNTAPQCASSAVFVTAPPH